MTFEEKIQYIINNDGSELGEYFYGLQRFLQCLSNDEEDKRVLEALEPIVNYYYITTKEEIEMEELNSLYTFNILPDNCLVYTKDRPELLIKVNNKLFNQSGENIPVHSDQQFLIHTTIYSKNTST